MKRLFVTSCFSLVALVIIAQYDFEKGYNEGFPIGYCYYEGNGCFCPITPIPPIPSLTESFDSYLDGYNRGLLEGIKMFNEKKSVSTFQNSTKKLNPYAVPHIMPEMKIPEFDPFTPNYDFYEQVLSQKQQEYNLKNQTSQNQTLINPNLDKFLKEHFSEENIELRKQFIKFCKEQYSTFTSFPTYFENGWYKALIIFEPPSGQIHPSPSIKENCDVLVQDNKIILIEQKDLLGRLDVIRYPSFFPSIQFQELDGIIERNNSIVKGKTTYVGNLLNAYKYGENFATTYQVFFNEYLTEYNSAQNLLSEIKYKYKSKTTYEKISNGWHYCYLTNNVDFCAVRSVYLENGKLVKWVSRDGTENVVDSGGEIANCKTTFSKIWPPSNNPNLSKTFLGKPRTVIYDAYFIDL